MKIHNLAQVHPKAILGKDVEIGPFSVVDEHVHIGDGTILKNNVTITGKTVIGKNNKFFHNAIIGSEPQDISYRGEETSLIIGDGNVIRECVTISKGTKKGGGVTIIGNNNLFMACCHIAHDCIIADNVIIANSVLLGGHIKVEKHANLMGQVGVHPFVTIGQYTYIGGLTRIVQDVPPFMIVEGNPSKVRHVNVIGLQRGGFSEEKIHVIKEAYKCIFRPDTLNRSEKLDMLEKKGDLIPEVKILIEFLRNMEKGKHGRYLESLRQKH